MGEDETDASKIFSDWMSQLRLSNYLEKAEAWCQEKGIVGIDEIGSHVDDFCSDLHLKTLEVKRVKKYFGDLPGAAPLAPVTPAVVAPSLPPGAQGTFGSQQYAIMEELGTGATATVYRCVKIADPSQSFAAKVISLAKLKMQREFKKMTQTLNREMQILFGLKHPRIVTLFDVIEENDKLYLIMEMVQGGELFDYIVERGTLTEPGAKNVFVQIVDALKYVHSKDIVYRDLKPENVLVNGKDIDETSLQIKLSDFGHSKLVNDGYSTALTRVGTPQYWAPEVSDSSMAARGYDQTVDLWSLGVILYVMLIGSYPFDGVKEPIERQIQNPRLRFVSPITGRVPTEPAQSLISSLIRVRSKDRLPLDGCLKHAWVRDTALVQATSQSGEYCAMQLPTRPTREQRDQTVEDLLKFQKKFRCFAQVRPNQVIADLNGLSLEQASEAKEDLRGIIKHNLGIEPIESTVHSLGGSSGLATVEEQPATYRLHTTTLRVGAKGAGIDLIAENGGMRVEGVFATPGQPGLMVKDLIIKINEVPLVGAPETVESIFGENFGDGVQIAVRRRIV